MPRNIVFNPRGTNARGLWTWVWHRGYREIEDALVSAAANCYRTAMVVFVPVAVVLTLIVAIT